MSDPPPSYGGHPNYAQQWPPAYPSMIPPNFPINSDYSRMSQPSATNPGPTFDYNMASVNANSRIAGSSGPGNSAFIPPQFPFFNHFDTSQFPSPFPPMPFPPIGYPPLPTGSSNVPITYQAMDGRGSNQLSTPAVHPNDIPAHADNHREEGEVSEESDERSLQPARKATRQYMDLEEGETMSSSAQSSRSTYNPPLSVSADPSIVHHAIQSQRQDSPATVPPPPAQKSVAQLRIQAQGALLSLAPHNIRYSELVAEGINPVVLRRLYEEVGIKVPTSPAQGPTVPEKASAASIVAAKELESSKPAELGEVVKESDNTTKPNLPVVHPSVPSVPSSSKSGKPMERKELIARMLAEKAAKATSKETSPTGSAKSLPTIPAEEARPVQKETLAKEKSKAQTELARQRIEELKRQTLLKTQKLAQANLLPAQSESPAPAIQHPLPVRPPVPESRRSVALPGLLMTRSEEQPNEAVASEAVRTIDVDSTPVSRASQRKRPRASDFDEPVAPLKKNFNPAAPRFDPADRLIIAISDDEESLYGDDEDDNMELDSSPEQEQAPIVTSTSVKPPIQSNPPVIRASTSTPQAPSSLSDQGDIRLKDLEIQAMRRKIAELELRRKSKLAASRTQSPRNLDDSGASSSGGPSSVVAATSEEDTLKTKPTTAAPSSLIPGAHVSEPEALAEGAVAQEPLEKAYASEVANGVIDRTAETSASFESDSAGSAMQESDDNSSDSSDSSSESEEEPVSSPSQADADAAIVPSFSEPMEIGSSVRSASRSSPSAITRPSANSADEYASQHHLSEQSQREESVESDGYEPPEPDTEAQSEGSSYSPPPFSPALTGLVENTAGSAPSFDLTQADEELTPAPQISDVSEPSPRSDLQVGAPNTEASRAISEQRFTPYTSPLRTFKAYRYHPHYTEDVPSGYRSLTYSHNIDSMKYMCPYELAGGVCNDRSCEFQHLRDMTLSDDKILVQMGSVREGQTEEEKEKYLAGLKEIINDLRRDKVKDFNTVASEIAAYRRRFLQDPSRVLSL
ncbi:uncharacterized protein PGRI_058660 [Penicillium griseofulvum]|uniref:Putative zinc-finger domain-containing protein n=1 Tax=Penicillium patulum TaxID=5078 RepID=A0A135LLQ9_PENPA|nr:uncharacterized protein PGRI_058660 [Penicillium griseofulvum]KXG49898.1 hypothetical protein PGRI_058660 [Penicillium griseofulvum]